MRINENNRPKIGLALGSGGARGLAHIGVIKVLEANHIPIDFIAGSSIGALIGGLYAATKDINKIEEIILSGGKKQLLDLMIDPSITGGFISGDKIEDFVSGIIDDVGFKNLKIPFAAVATDLKTGKPVVIEKGKVSNAIRSSIAVPLVFKPIRNGKKFLVDGGLSSPVPVEIVKNMGADYVVAVNVDAHCSYHKDGDKLGLRDIVQYTFSMMRSHLSRFSSQSADVVIEPNINSHGVIGWKDFLDGKNIIKKGESAAKLSIIKMKGDLKRLKVI